MATRSHGGPERQILGVATRHERSRFRPLIVSFVSYHGERRPVLDEANRAGLPTAAVRMTATLDPRGVSGLARMLRQEAISLVATYGYKADILGLMAGRLVGVPVVATCGGWTGHTRLVCLYEALDKLALRLADRVIAVSEATRSALLQSGVDPRRIAVVPNAVDGERFRPGDGSRLRAELGVAPDTAVIVSVGRLSREKGHRYLIDAAAQLRSPQRIHLLFVGDGPEKPALERLVASHDMTAMTTFAGWRTDVVPFYRAADIVVLPSLTEGLPVALLEAMACGKPVVASDVGGVAEVLGASAYGLVVPPANPSALTNALACLVERRHFAHALAERARERATQMTFDTSVRLLEHLYADVLRVRGPGRRHR
ncbi:MAG: glycosyltransferase [Armatimonadota bacterium]|nr:MAG: glycosyltransferase [Armatimonadota bacterium]